MTAAYPKRIARQARAIVEHQLYQFGFTPPDDFNDRLEILGAAIAFWGARLNLTASPEDPAALAFHVLDSMMPLVIAATRPAGGPIREAFAAGRRVLDLGSGAGFPALVLAAISPATFVLREARRKRVSFLTVTAAEMGLKNVTIDSERAEAGVLAAVFDTVTARAFGPPESFLHLAGVALKPGGLAILYASPEQDLDQAAVGAAGLGDNARIDYSLPRGDEPVAHVLAIWSKRQ
jgi:16S rRNA (guanine527-N7)-methyltransferase